MVESGRVRGKCRIRPSIDNLRRGVLEKYRIYVSTEKWQNPAENREMVESVRVSKNCPASTGKGSNLCEYRKMVESGRVPGKGRIRPSIDYLRRGVPEKGRICVSTKNSRIRVSIEKLSRTYRKRVESV